MVWTVSFGPSERRTHGRGACAHERDRATPSEISRPLVEAGVCRAGGCARIRGWDPGSPWGVEGGVPLTAPELGWQSRLSHAGLLSWLCLPSPSKGRGQR